MLILTGQAARGALAAALAAGVAGYLRKDRLAGDLIGAIRAVARGEWVIDPRLAGSVPGGGQEPPPAV